MVVGKPTDCELWPKVEPLITWPVSDEDQWSTCARAWGNAGGSFVETASTHASPVDANLAAGWTDQAGQDYRTKAAALYRTTADTGGKMQHAGWLAGQYADDVKYAKTQIAQEVRANESAYEDKTWLYFFPDDAARDQMAQKLAVGINSFLRQMADRIRARGTGQDLPRPQFPKGTADNWQIVYPPFEPEPPYVSLEELGDIWRRLGFKTQNDFGKWAWGGNTGEELEGFKTEDQLAKMRAGGFTVADAQKLRDLYQRIYNESYQRYATGQSRSLNSTAYARAQLFQWYMDNL